MAYPTDLDTLTNPGPTDALNDPSHSGQHSDANDAIEVLQVKLGVDGSAVVTSIDYLLKNTASIDPGHKHSELWASDGDPQTADIDAAGNLTFSIGPILVNNVALYGVDTGATARTLIRINASDDVEIGSSTQGWVKLLSDTANSNFMQFPISRQGGSATAWGTAGTTAYAETDATIQSGVVEVVTGATGTTLTFPVAFSDVPILILGGIADSAAHPVPNYSSLSATNVVIKHDSAGTRGVPWIAIGSK